MILKNGETVVDKGHELLEHFVLQHADNVKPVYVLPNTRSQLSRRTGEPFLKNVRPILEIFQKL